jgi:hypothetical protein
VCSSRGLTENLKGLRTYCLCSSRGLIENLKSLRTYCLYSSRDPILPIDAFCIRCPCYFLNNIFCVHFMDKVKYNELLLFIFNFWLSLGDRYLCIEVQLTNFQQFLL